MNKILNQAKILLDKLLEWSRVYYGAILGFLVIFFLMAAGPTPKRSGLEFGGGYNYDHFVISSCNENLYEVNSKTYQTGAKLNLPINENFVLDLFTLYRDTKNDVLYLSENKRFSNTQHSGITSFHLSFSLDYVGFVFGYNFILYDNDKDYIFYIYPGGSIWVNLKYNYIYASYLHFDNFSKPTYLNVGVGSNNDYFHWETGLKYLEFLLPAFKDNNNSSIHSDPTLIFLYFKYVHKFNEKYSGGVLIDFGDIDNLQLTLTFGYNF